MLRVPFAHLITISGFKEDTPDSNDPPTLLRFDGRLRLFGLRRFHVLSSFEYTEITNREPSAIVPQGIP
ncbi:MAG: hypothetical protein WAM69_09800, partial [Candidatus Sulfotelmatobacter sp.]